jgi:hypothetical protein
MKKPRANCPYKIAVWCDLTPPYNFIRETFHVTKETALRAVAQARKEFKGTPGLRIVLTGPQGTKPKTFWERILAV